MHRSSLSRSMGVLLLLAVAAGCEREPETTPQGEPATTQPPTGGPAGGTTGAPGAPAGAAASGDLVAQGQQVYSGPGICFTCHGPNGNGTALGPALNDGQWIWVEEGQDLQTQLVTIIRTGVAQPREHPAPMPPMGGANLSEDQLEAVAAYIVSLNQ